MIMHTFLKAVAAFSCKYKIIKFSFIVLFLHCYTIFSEEMMLYVEVEPDIINFGEELIKEEIKKSVEHNLPHLQVLDYSEKYFLAVKIKDFKTYFFEKTDYYGFLGSVDLHVFLYDLEKQSVLLEEEVKGSSTCPNYNRKDIFIKSFKNAQTQIVEKFLQKIGITGKVIAIKNDLLIINMGKRHGIKKNTVLNVFDYKNELLVKCLVEEISHDECAARTLEKYSKKIYIENTIITFKTYKAKKNYASTLSESDLVELFSEEKSYTVVIDNLELSQFNSIDKYMQLLSKKNILYINYKKEVVFNDYSHELKNFSLIYNLKTFSSTNNFLKKIFNMAWKNFSVLEHQNLIIFFVAKKKKYNVNNNQMMINLKNLQRRVYKTRNNILIKDISNKFNMTFDNCLVNYFSKFIKEKICVFPLPSDEKFVFCHYEKGMLTKIMKVEK